MKYEQQKIPSTGGPPELMLKSSHSVPGVPHTIIYIIGSFPEALYEIKNGGSYTMYITNAYSAM